MAGLINQLIECLNNEASLYEEILNVSKEETDVIVRGDLESINKTVNELEELAVRAKKLETERIQLLKDVALVLNKNKETITITEIIESLKSQPEERKSLSEAASSIKFMLDEVRNVSDLNKSLIAQSLDYIDFSVNVLQSSFVDTPVNYTKNEIYGANLQNKSFFDAKQ